ncbi:MAG TPA: hypothetical protein ENI82_01545 [Bacteroidetes bacterium]|nr:hypothetical protein [Bacteroidota bacterium]
MIERVKYIISSGGEDVNLIGTGILIFFFLLLIAIFIVTLKRKKEDDIRDSHLPLEGDDMSENNELF